MTVRDGRGRFVKGNQAGNGRPKGSRNKMTERAKAILEGDADTLMHHAIKMAKGNSETIMGKLLDRIYPVPKQEGPVDDFMRLFMEELTGSPESRL